jgi:hypothetical protein
LEIAAIQRNTSKDFFLKLNSHKTYINSKILPKINKDILRKYIKSGFKNNGFRVNRKGMYFKKNCGKSGGTCSNFYS